MDNLSAEDEVAWWVAYEQFPFAEYWVCPGCGAENDRMDSFVETVECEACPAQVPWPFPRREDLSVTEAVPAWVRSPLQCILCLADVCVTQSRGDGLDLNLVACTECYVILLDLERAARAQDRPVPATPSGGGPCLSVECHTPTDDGGDAIARFRFPRPEEKVIARSAHAARGFETPQ